MSRPVLDAFDAVKSSSSALTCHNIIHVNNIISTSATNTSSSSNINSIVNDNNLVERLSSAACHHLPPLDLPSQHSCIVVQNIQPVVPTNADFNTNFNTSLGRSSVSPSGAVARVPKRILLPPLPVSAPRKRSRMNPTHAHTSDMESPGFGLYSVSQPLLPALPHGLHPLPVSCSSSNSAGVGAGAGAGAGFAQHAMQQSDLGHHVLPPLQPNTHHLPLPYSVAMPSNYLVHNPQLHPYHATLAQQPQQLQQHIHDQGQQWEGRVQPQLHSLHPSDHGLVPTSLLAQSYVDPCSPLDLANITHSMPTVPSGPNMFSQPLQQHAYPIHQQSQQQQTQQTQQTQQPQSDHIQHQYQYQSQPPTHAEGPSLLHDSRQRCDPQFFGQQPLGGHQSQQQQTNLMPPLHPSLISRPRLHPPETRTQPPIQPLVMQVQMPDQLANDLFRQDVHPRISDALGDRFNSTWLSDSSSTHDGLTHNVTHNNPNVAGIAVDASTAMAAFSQQHNTSSQHADLKSSLKRNRNAALPSTKSAIDKAHKVAKTHSKPSTGLSAVAKRAIGTGPAKCEDDRDGHLVYKLGQGLHVNTDFPNGRYKILDDLGEGTFGKVVECWDRQELRRVAVKVVRSINKYRQAARLEIDVLLRLNSADPNSVFHCVKLRSWFEFHSHVCMVFEKLGPSLYDQLRQNQFQPFPLDQVRDYAFQLLESINFVHSLTLIHTDLKPENILLASATDGVASTGGTMGGAGDIDNSGGAGSGVSPFNLIKLIDFGSATFEAQHHSPLISTRHYRAPEVILGLGWTYPCDLWSVGCILVELYTGQALFQTHENLEHLAMMSHVLGPIPDSMAKRTEGQGLKYFRNKGGRRLLNWPAGASSKASIHTVRRIQSLDNLIRCAKGHDDFLDLVKKLLAFEPDTRCTSEEALRHPFFRNMGRNNWNPQIQAVSAAWHKNAEEWNQFIPHHHQHQQVEQRKQLRDQQQQILRQGHPVVDCNGSQMPMHVQDDRLVDDRIEAVDIIVPSVNRRLPPPQLQSQSDRFMHTRRAINFAQDGKREQVDDDRVDASDCAAPSLKQDDDNDVGIDRIVHHNW